MVSHAEADWIELEHWGGLSGRRLLLDRAHADTLSDVMSWVQDHVIDELGSHGNNWPPCPHHPDSHPLDPRVHDGAAWWCCPRDGVAVTEVGTLE